MPAQAIIATPEKDTSLFTSPDLRLIEGGAGKALEASQALFIGKTANHLVELNDSNLVLSFFEPKIGCNIIKPMSSAIVVESLHIFNDQPVERQRLGQSAICFFDIHGDFFDQQFVKDVRLSSGQPNASDKKHVVDLATFGSSGWSVRPMAIDDIAIVTKSPHPLVWEGSDS